MDTFFGAIADDFTGATDLAGLLARSGARVSLRMGVPLDADGVTAPIEVIALKCRTASSDQAVGEALSALNWLRKAGAKRFFWKYCSTFDSTPRGNIGPVAEALMKELQAAQTIYCPAFPENSRYVFMGNLFVGEQPLAESPMKDHPLTPMKDSSLSRLLKPQVTAPIGLANRLVVTKGAAAIRSKLAEFRDSGVAHVIIDAVSNEDLLVIAEACSDMTLVTGGSAVAMPLPELWCAEGYLQRENVAGRRGDKRGRAIILSGSCSAMTNRQVSAYLEHGRPGFRLDPLSLAENGVKDALDWLSAQAPDAAPIIYATAAPDAVLAAQEKLGAEHASTIVESALAACATAARDLGARRFVVAGGETSGAVAKALGISKLDVGTEIAPGVPWCFAQTGGYDVAITLKSGNFGNEAFFTRALEILDA